MLHQLLFFFFFLLLTSTNSLDFLFNSFTPTTNLTLISDARVESSVIRLTNDSNPVSVGRAFYPSTIPIQSSSNISSFSTSFVFSILPQISSSPGFGLAFVLSNSTSPPGAGSGQYLGLFSTDNTPNAYPLLAIEFDIGQNLEFNDPDDNHVGIDLNNIESQETQPAGYYNSTGGFVPILMRNGQNIRAWIEFDGTLFQINVTIAPLSVSRPSIPLISFTNPVIANYVSAEMFVGFSASKATWVEPQRILAWSFSNTGIARDINTTNLPVFLPESSSSSSLSRGVIVGISVACIIFTLLCLLGVYWFWWRKKRNGKEEEEDMIEDWELEYWPHRFSYEELFEATNGFSKDELLGSGGFGRVYRGILSNNTGVGVKCVAHDSKQGLREFMAEISSMGRLQHKNLVQMRGWCRKGNELLLVYDYMPNGSLNRYIFEKPIQLMNWECRQRVLVDVAEGLSYLHHGWDQVVLHRDIKSSNILLDSDMRARLGDFGLAKLYQHGQAPGTTRVVGTLGYLAPELATIAAPTAATDVYSFGVVILEVVCGRRPLDSQSDDGPLLIGWVRKAYEEGKLHEAADGRLDGEYKVEDVEIMLKLGLACCHPDPQHRPTMKEVVAVLVGEEANVSVKPARLLPEIGRWDIGDDGGSSDGNSGVQEEDAPLKLA